MEPTQNEENSPEIKPGFPYARDPAALDRALFAPAMILAVLVILMTGAASLRIPLREAVVPVQYGLAAALAGWFYFSRPKGLARPMLLLTVLAGAACWFCLADYTRNLWPARGDLLNMHGDNFSYQAISDYLYRYPRGKTAGMPLVDEFGAHFAETRFATSSLFCLLQRTLLLRDLPSVFTFYLWICLVVHFFSMLALGRALVRRTEWFTPLCAAFLSTACGWVSRIFPNANNDNLIFAALVPAFLAVLCSRADVADHLPTGARVRRLVAGGVLWGAIIYNYAEGIPLLGVLILPLLVALFWPAGGLRAVASRWAEAIGIGVLGVCLTIPYLPTFYSYLRLQLAIGTAARGVRPGDGVLPGLVNERWLPASFALGEETPFGSYHLYNNLLPLVLLGLVFLGARALGQRQRWFPWVAVPIIGLYLWQNVSKHYDYGTYKVLLCAEWWIYLAISAGCSWLCARLHLATTARVAVFAVLLLVVGYDRYEDRKIERVLSTDLQNKSLIELSTVRFVTGKSPVLVDVNDFTDYPWVIYYMRDVPLAAWQHQGYLAGPQFASFLAQTNLPATPADCPYMLVSGQRPGALWQNSRFSLLVQPTVYVNSIDNPNGIESGLLWFGTKQASIGVVAKYTGIYEFSGSVFILGPSAPDRERLVLEIQDANGPPRLVEVTGDTLHIPITLAQGKNVFRLRCLGTPVPGPHNGDPRELMLMVKDPAFNPAPPAPAP